MHAMSVLALTSDLVMRSQISASATRTGVLLQVAGTEDGLLTAAKAGTPRLVILDLSHPRLDAASFVARLKPLLHSDGTIVAFGPHVHGDLLAAATAAGCQTVISRGQFHAQMDSILQRGAE